MSASAPSIDPAAPTSTRQLLAAAQSVAAGVGELTAAAMADLPLGSLAGHPLFPALLAECRAFDERPRAAQDRVLELLTRRAVERALAAGRVGAIPAAMRLLGLGASRPAPSSPGGGGPRPADPANDDEPDPAPADPGKPWGMRKDGKGGWIWPEDDRPVMPDRAVLVVEAPKGPARLLDPATKDGPDRAETALLGVLDDMGRADVDTFNRMALPHGGPQWDPVTRTLRRWPLRPPAGAVTPTDAKAASAKAAAPAVVPAVAAAAPTLPAPVPQPPPAPATDSVEGLRARLLPLLAEDGSPPRSPDEIDLAEAVCALLWPNWPPYAGAIDQGRLRAALAGRRLDGRILNRLGNPVPTPPDKQPTGRGRGPP